MKRLLIFLLLFSNIASAQYDYNQIASQVVDLVENSYVSFEDHIKGKEDYYYNYFKKELFADTLSNPDDLILRLNKYIRFFNDRHLYLSGKDILCENEAFIDESFESKVLNPNTVYLKINSFKSITNVGRLLKKSLDVDSLNFKNNLIIDLRDNGGGDYSSSYPLLQFIATNDIYVRKTKFLVTPENWSFHAKTSRLGEYKKELEGKIIDTPWERSGDYLVRHYKPYSTYEFPKHVAILVNRNTGSAAEQFVLYGKQSLKVKIFGENTGGLVDNGSINSYELIKDKLYLNYATVKKIDFDQNNVSSKGISPDFYLEKDDQIGQILNYLKYWE